MSERFPIGPGLFLGGVPQWFAFEEMQRSYISANYLAVVLCAQVFAEHALAFIYMMTGEDKVAKSGFARLIDRAAKDGEIEEHVAGRLHVLRKMRNPYTHPTPGVAAWDRRKPDELKHPLVMLEEDAVNALDTVALLFPDRRK